MGQRSAMSFGYNCMDVWIIFCTSKWTGAQENMSVGSFAPQEACKSAPFGFPTMQITGCSVVNIYNK